MHYDSCLKDRIMAAMDFFNQTVVHTWTYKPTGRPDMIRTSETLV
jgi:hypothetical protein